jgi:hypothetical protein
MTVVSAVTLGAPLRVPAREDRDSDRECKRHATRVPHAEGLRADLARRGDQVTVLGGALIWDRALQPEAARVTVATA